MPFCRARLSAKRFIAGVGGNVSGPLPTAAPRRPAGGATGAGAAPADLGQSLANAAALRIARFGNANEHADWETAHHVFTYANAVHRMLTRIGAANIDSPVTAVRGILHGTIALYLARYLNCPGRRSGRRRQASRRPARRRRDDPRRIARRLRPTATGRSRRKPGSAISQARPFAAGANRHARARGAARRCGLPHLSDTRGGSPAVRRVEQH